LHGAGLVGLVADQPAIVMDHIVVRCGNDVADRFYAPKSAE
jgi:hypothetical protein